MRRASSINILSHLLLHHTEFNPNLGDVTRATRVAYVKFMKKKMAADEDGAAAASEEASATSATITDEKAAGGVSTNLKVILYN